MNAAQCQCHRRHVAWWPHASMLRLILLTVAAARGTAATAPRAARNSSYFSGVQRMGIIGIIGTIIVGFIVGLLARWFMPGVDKLGFWLTTALGIGGSVVGGFISGLIFKSPDGKFHPAGWIMSILGAMLLLWAYNNYMR